MRTYALTVFLSAFLLFQIEPIVARHILPWFGGSASVSRVGNTTLTATPDYARIKSLTYATASPEDKAHTRASWDRRDVLASAFILACILAAYVYFSG